MAHLGCTIGIDIGTSSVKAIAFDAKMQALAHAAEKVESRHDDAGADSEFQRQTEHLFFRPRLAQQCHFGIMDQHRKAGRQNREHRNMRMFARREPAHDVADHLAAFGSGMRAGNQFRVAMFILDENEAIVGDRGDDQVGYILERRLVVERGRELLACLGKEVAGHLMPAWGGALSDEKIWTAVAGIVSLRHADPDPAPENQPPTH